jgi:hypothetical protein
MSGKGDKRRPLKVSKEQLDENWERAFNKKEAVSAQDLDEYTKEAAIADMRADGVDEAIIEALVEQDYDN